jgi:16S rRNA processing protein RimM
MEEFVQIGHTQKPHGVEGELRIFIEDAYLEDFLHSHALFIDLGGQKVPYFIEYIRGAHEDILKLEDITSPEMAQTLASKPVFLRAADLIPDHDRENSDYQPEYEFLEGFMAEDVKMGELGLVLRVDEFPQQEMAVVEYQGREVLIPLNPQLIQGIDEARKKIRFQLPEGLLDL